MEVLEKENKSAEGEEGDFKVPEKPREAEGEKEKLLQSKYGKLKAKSGSNFLQQRMASRGVKYFDSGDYNVARAKMQKQSETSLPLEHVTGKKMPTLEQLSKGKRQPGLTSLAKPSTKQ